MYQRLRADELVSSPEKKGEFILWQTTKSTVSIRKSQRPARKSQSIRTLKGLEAQKTEAENLEIVQLVRAMRMTPQELNAMLSGGGIPGMSAAPASDEAADYEEQEDNADEE